ncbi:WAT1-related protein At4g28040-like [Punica granatum]|uniref:WAT1-related protein n=1 Tax=Punica granatum TaxID=22663 RepID=A0A6P8D6D9_PUNGR|nr:WAT1-related protein At4g28040-like [Punica granatum]
MVGIQCIYAGNALFSKAAFQQGMKPPVFDVYRQAICSLIIAPLALYNRMRNSLSLWLGLKTSGLIFAAGFFGIVVNQNAYLEGLNLSSATVATAMIYLVPVITFVMATAMGQEEVDFRSMKSLAKILGTVVCVGGAVSMALLKGSKLLNRGEYTLTIMSLLGLQIQSWLLGCLFLFVACICWSSWLILLQIFPFAYKQKPISTNCPDNLNSTTLTCVLATLQSAAVALILEREWLTWRINTALDLGACLFTGTGAVFVFVGQAWCVSERGPVFTAMFNPLNTVLATIFASIFLHEALYIGSLLGAGAVTVGLYIVLWGKANDQEDTNHEQEEPPTRSISASEGVPIRSNDDDHQVLADGSSERMKKETSSNSINLQQPFLLNSSSNLEEP